jgi:UDP-glucose 4-epimerase
MAKERVLVTGGAGFIGSHLTRRLLSEGYDVTVIDNLSRNVNNLTDLIEEKKIKFIKGDIREKDHVEMAAEGCDYVMHMAAVCINRCKAFPKEAIEVNLNGSYNVFGAAIKNNFKKVIYTSTSSVFGQPEYLPMDEKLPKKCAEPYGATKYCAEQMLEFLSKKHDLPYVIIRPFNVYGTYQSTDAYYTSVINLFIKKLLTGGRPTIHGSGDQSMDFTHVSDLVEAYVRILKSDVKNEDFNVAPGKDVSIKDLAYTIIKQMGLDAEPEFIPREVLVTRRQANNTKISEAVGLEFKVDIDTGVKELVDHVRDNIDSY